VIHAVTCRTGGGRFRRTWTSVAASLRRSGYQVALDGVVAAGVALLGDLGVQRGGTAHTGCESLVQVRLERVEVAGPHAAGDQLLDAVGAQIAAHGLQVHAEPAGNHSHRQALHPQSVNLQETRPGARRPRRALQIQHCQARRLVGTVFAVIPRRRHRGGLDKAGVVRGHQLVHVLAQVVPHVPPVCHLRSLRCAVTGAVGVTAGAVSADHLDTGVGTQPVGEVPASRPSRTSTGRFPSLRSTNTVP